MIRPLGNRIIVGKVNYEPRTLSGLEVVHDAEKPRTGFVLSAGPEVHSIQPGNIVYYSRYAGHPIRDPNTDTIHTVLFEQDVLGFE